MLGLGVALNIFLDGWRGAINFFELRLRTAPRDFFFAALVLGGLAFLNTWDILAHRRAHRRRVRSRPRPRRRLGLVAPRRRLPAWHPARRRGHPALPAFLPRLFLTVGRHPPQPRQPDARRASLGHVGDSAPPALRLADLSDSRPRDASTLRDGSRVDRGPDPVPLGLLLAVGTRRLLARDRFRHPIPCLPKPT